MDLLNLAIVGAAASVITQLLKAKVSDGLPRALFAIVISLVLGTIAYVLNFVPEIKTALIGVIVLSNVIYGTVIKYLIEK